jgi:hypothetical protein
LGSLPWGNLYKDGEEGERGILLLGKFEDKAKKSWHGSGLRDRGLLVVMTKGLVGRRVVPHTLLRHARSRIGVPKVS